MAQELLARQREGSAKQRIASVCLLNGGLFPETHKPVLIQKLLLSPLGPLVSKLITKRKFADNLRRIFGPNTPPTPEVVDSLWQLLNHNNGLAVMHKLIDYMPQRQQHRERWVEAIIESNVPVKLINGSKDPISGQHMAQRYRQLISNASNANDVTELTQLGHYPQLEDAEAVTTAYLQFRDSLNQS
ncbi:alpha/beta hydrolase [uncultured Psychrobacter sp.]|uniref:alpha/beta fold hydrolase n=1 Tax=uncultured Psychrobacter sp. TaxID=259303 RepID=UPI0026141526|nr:alpha/beta hydrolase [uncultured Psychrobacter sp.]